MLAALFVIALGVVPVALLGGAASVTPVSGGQTAVVSVGSIGARYAYALVPFGFGVWLAHYGFHFLTGALTIVPVTQSAVIDVLGWAGARRAALAVDRHAPGAVFPIQTRIRPARDDRIARAVADRISERDYPRSHRSRRPCRGLRS